MFFASTVQRESLLFRPNGSAGRMVGLEPWLGRLVTMLSLCRFTVSLRVASCRFMSLHVASCLSLRAFRRQMVLWCCDCGSRLCHAYLHDMNATSIMNVATVWPPRLGCYWRSAFCRHAMNIGLISDSPPLWPDRPLVGTLCNLVTLFLANLQCRGMYSDAHAKSRAGGR